MSNFHSKQKGTQVHNPKRFEEASDNSLLAKIDGNVAYLTTNHTSTLTLTPFADVNGSLNNKYFYLYTSNNTKKVVVIFNVGGLGNLITPDGCDLRIDVSLDTNDDVATIIDELVIALNGANTTQHRIHTSLTDNTTHLTLVNKGNTLAGDFNTGFTFSTAEVQVAQDEYLVSEATTGNLVFKSAATGLGDKTFVHTQNEASASWVIDHNLSKYPSVTVVDSAGTTVVGQVDYQSTSRATITFISSFSGTAYFN